MIDDSVDLFPIVAKLLEKYTGRNRATKIAEELGIEIDFVRDIIYALPDVPVAQTTVIDIDELHEMACQDVSKDRTKRFAAHFNVVESTILRYLRQMPDIPWPEASTALEQGRRRHQRDRKNLGCLSKTHNYRRDQRQNLVREARQRAKKKGLDFDLYASDIVVPEVCPILGIPIVAGRGKFAPESPNLDRVHPARGYVWDNVLVISCRANTIKKDATPEELRKLADFYEKWAPAVERAPIDKCLRPSGDKLNAELCEQLKQDWLDSMPLPQIMAKYDISKCSVYNVVKGIRKGVRD